MDTKTLLTGIIGFILGGLIVSTAAVTLNKPEAPAHKNGQSQMMNQDMSMSMDDMTNALRGKTGDDFDKAFISTMIEHHEGAVEMAQMAESQAKHEEIKQLSRDIITAQEKEIAQMKAWQNEWGYNATPAHEQTQH